MKFNHTAHKALWNWLAENPDKVKDDWPEWEENGGSILYIHNDCFACEYATRTKPNWTQKCPYCPLEWPINDEGDRYCIDSDELTGLFIDYLEASSNPDLRATFALQIANLPVKPGVECE